jgi:hypothetical protein
LPRANFFFTLGPLGPVFEPPYSRQLGLLAQILGKLDDAVRHLADAEARTTAVGLRAHLARLRYELAGALAARGAPGDREQAAALLREARALAEELGQRDLLPLLAAGREAPLGERSRAARSFSITREGHYWAVAWNGRALRLRDSRGMHVLARLVSSPGQEFHVLQLVSSIGEPSDHGDAGTVLDTAAVRSYRRRLLDLREALEEAEGFGDGARAERARAEVEALTCELARAVGLGGRERRAGGAAERARTTVQKRLRSAIRSIEAELPELGTHLDQTVRTGSFCGYLPEGRRRAR